MATPDSGWRWAAAAAGLGALAVVLGAFGAHAVADVVSPARLATWRTAALYHVVHAAAGVGAGVLAAHGVRAALWAARWFTAGVVLFSGSLYALVLLDIGALGAVAPVGGLAFIAGWGVLTVALWRQAGKTG